MTQNQIKIIDKAEEYAKRGYLIDTRWAFAGFEATIVELHNDHDSFIKLNGRFSSRFDAIEFAMRYIDKNLPKESAPFS